MSELSVGDYSSDDERIHDQWNPLTDEINTLTAELIRLTSEQLTLNCREQLDQWRENCHTIINRFYERKCEELNRHGLKRLRSCQSEIDQIRGKMSQLMSEHRIADDDLEMLT